MRMTGPASRLVAAAFLSLLCCTRSPQLNVLVVTFDTTRADRIGCYGYARAATPTVDRLAREGVRFTRCFTPVPVTLPAHASLFTGLYPPVHGVRDNGTYRLESGAVTLAELLASAGFETGAVIGAYVVTSRFGLAQGFGHYDERLTARPDQETAFFVERNAAEVTEAAIAWLDTVRRPFALWVHYFDPHSPYRPPAPFDTVGADPYDGEIAYADFNLGRLVDYLKATGRWDNTLIVVAGDHGEALGEHGEPTHGIFLYNSTLHVPLVLRFPGELRAGRTVADNVSLVDVLPTVLEAAGLDALREIDGRSLLPSIDSRSAGLPGRQRTLYFETRLPENTFGWHSLEGMLYGDMKYIEAPESELYDIGVDFAESADLVSWDSAGLGESMARFASLRRELSRRERNLAGRLALDSESAERLRALGYVAGRTSRQAEGSRPDPKRMIRTLGRFMTGVMAEAEGDYDRALAVFDSVLAVDPDNVYACQYKGFIYMERGEHWQAIAEFTRAVEKKPDSPANFLLALAWRSLDSLDAAKAWLERTIQVIPSHARANAMLADILWQQGEGDQALRRMETARRLAPQDKEILNDLGKMLLDRGDNTGAGRCFEQALAVDSLYPLALYNLGISAYRAGDLEKAERSLRKVADMYSGDGKVQLNLGVVLAARGETDQARRAYRRAIEADSGYAPAWNNLGNLEAAAGRKDTALACLDR
ncbi:MAG: sulfatase-like hydrolase/transferase, partial [Candidatus Glassbacteria bacterium]